MTPGSFSGLRVYDASRGVAGPHCTSLMALCGAEVIKVEPPAGDWGRHIGQRFAGMGAFFATYNRGKKSVVLDLKHDADVATARRLIATCDVVVESFRPGVMEKLGLGCEAVRALRADVVYLSVSGFGQHGPASGDGGLDTMMQAYTGWMHVNRGRDGTPVLMDHIGVDVITGLYAFQSCTAALLRRFRFGDGARLDISLLNAGLAFLAPRVAEHVLAGGAMQDAVTPPTGVWKTRDHPIAIADKDQGQFARLCNALDRAELAEDPRFASRDARMANKAALHALLQPLLLERTRAEWLEHLNAKGIPAASINDFADVLSSAQVRALQLVREGVQPGPGAVPVVAVPGLGCADILAPAPALGEHTRAILDSLDGPR